MKGLTTTMIAGLALLGAAGPAAGQTVVSMDAVDVRDARAIEALYQSVQDGAERECRRAYGGQSAFGPRARRRAIERCVEETIEDVVARSGLAELRAEHVLQREPATPRTFADNR